MKMKFVRNALWLDSGMVMNLFLSHFTQLTARGFPNCKRPKLNRLNMWAIRSYYRLRCGSLKRNGPMNIRMAFSNLRSFIKWPICSRISRSLIQRRARSKCVLIVHLFLLLLLSVFSVCCMQHEFTKVRRPLQRIQISMKTEREREREKGKKKRK